MARIEDVARAAGVSTATVSRALRGLPNVSEQTRLAVTAAAAELGYVISRSASTLATGRTRTIAVVTPYVERWFFGQIIGAVESVLRKQDFDALLVSLTEPFEGGDQVFDPLSLRGRADAVIVLTLPLNENQMRQLTNLHLPTVYVGSLVPGAISVRIDDVAAARMATEHLLALGHTRIAYVGGKIEHQVGFFAPAARHTGWLNALEAAGIAPRPEYQAPGDFTPAGGLAAGRALLSLKDPPTAVFATSDEMAFGVLAAARRLNVRVPEDLSVIGIDGHELADVVELTTVEQPVRRQGAISAQLALDALEVGDAAIEQDVVVDVQLVQRKSTAAASSRRRRRLAVTRT